MKNEACCFDYPVDPETTVIGASTDIDFTDMFPCSSYASSPLDFKIQRCHVRHQQLLLKEEILVSADLVLCGNLTLLGCQTVLEPDVKIIVPNG
ncbi:MAG: hypothetical protein IPK08_19940, partial [Bacteroidetes bacterium]|nr:hypothetical protein [Bacteroidota bacterium]